MLLDYWNDHIVDQEGCNDGEACWHVVMLLVLLAYSYIES